MRVWVCVHAYYSYLFELVQKKDSPALSPKYFNLNFKKPTTSLIINENLFSVQVSPTPTDCSLWKFCPLCQWKQASKRGEMAPLKYLLFKRCLQSTKAVNIYSFNRKYLLELCQGFAMHWQFYRSMKTVPNLHIHSHMCVQFVFY